MQSYLCARHGFCCLVCLPVTSRRSDGTKTRQESIYEAFILGSYGVWQVIGNSYIPPTRDVSGLNCSQLVKPLSHLVKALSHLVKALSHLVKARFSGKARSCFLKVHAASLIRPCKVTQLVL